MSHSEGMKNQSVREEEKEKSSLRKSKSNINLVDSESQSDQEMTNQKIGDDKITDNQINFGYQHPQMQQMPPYNEMMQFYNQPEQFHEYERNIFPTVYMNEKNLGKNEESSIKSPIQMKPEFDTTGVSTPQNVVMHDMLGNRIPSIMKYYPQQHMPMPGPVSMHAGYHPTEAELEYMRTQ